MRAGVINQRGMLTSPKHLIPPLICLGVRVCPALNFVFLIGLTRLTTISYIHNFILYDIDHCSLFSLIVCFMSCRELFTHIGASSVAGEVPQNYTYL